MIVKIWHFKFYVCYMDWIKYTSSTTITKKMNLYRKTVQGYNVKRIGRLTMSLSVRVQCKAVFGRRRRYMYTTQAGGYSSMSWSSSSCFFFLLFIIFINKINVAYCFRIHSLYLYEKIQYFIFHQRGVYHPRQNWMLPYPQVFKIKLFFTL